MSNFTIDPATTMGAVYLTITDMDRALRFYVDILGFRPQARRANVVALTADGQTPLIVLTAQPTAKPRPRRTAGLYHVALLEPSRADLGRTLRHLAQTRYPLQGAADHLVSEALYLADPDGNGLEIYRDRPRDEWPVQNGQVRMTTDPLDVEGVLAAGREDGRPWDGMPGGTRVGHVHLQASDLRAAERFYAGALGFGLMQRFGPSALFVSAGGYHHHLGMNTWDSLGAPPTPPDTVGLRHLTIQLPDEAAQQRVGQHVQEQGYPAQAAAGAWWLNDPSSGAGVILVAGQASLEVESLAVDPV
jgi:catechol 2,3-dioxygenase